MENKENIKDSSKMVKNKDEKIKILPKNIIWKNSEICLGVLMFINIILITFTEFKIFNLKNYYNIIISLCLLIVLLGIAIFFLRLKKPKMDNWIGSIASRRVGCEVIYYIGKKIYINYDVSLNKKDINEFIMEISDKSNKYSYFLEKIDIDHYIFTMSVTKKQEIPKRCEIDKSTDTLWNFIPMGESRNNKTKKISQIGWYLNDLNKNQNAIDNLPSTSLVIAGGTGSGKSVVENGIIGHITRFPDNIQGLLADVKRVEFGGLEEYKGIHAVALTIEDVEQELSQARAIMQNRFEFMQNNHVNNIYKLKNDVDWYEIDGKKYQFDEIFRCEINDKKSITTLDKIVQAVNDGMKVKIDI